MLLIVPIDAVWGRIFCDPAHRLWLWKCVGDSDRHIRIFLKVLYLFHDFTEYLWAVLRRVAVLHKANLNIQLKLIADILIIEPVGERGFCVYDLFDLLRQFPAPVIYDYAIDFFVRCILRLNSAFFSEIQST